VVHEMPKDERVIAVGGFEYDADDRDRSCNRRGVDIAEDGCIWHRRRIRLGSTE
jgi:hypothetical protein